MKRFTFLISATIISGALAGAAAADDQIIWQEQIAHNTCHTVVQNNSEMADKSGSRANIVEFWGPCDQPEWIPDRTLNQEHAEYFRFGRDYERADLFYLWR